jgi:hemolysin activation/secretion protein
VLGLRRVIDLMTLAVCVLGVATAARAQSTLRPFDLEELRVEGNTILSETEIDDAVYPFLGPNRTAADVEKARAALEEVYSKKGYATVSAIIPPQEPVDGVVIIKVVERPIGRLRVVGAQYVAPRVIRREAPSLAEGTIPNLNDAQRDVVALNQQPDLTVTPSLRPGKAPDTVDVDLKVDDKLPLHGSLELNNRYSPDTTPLRLNGNVSYDNLWQRGDTIAFGFQVAPENYADASVYTGSYTFRIPNSKVSLLVNYLYSNSDVVTLGNTDAIGKGTTVQIRALVPLGTVEDFTHSLSVGFDYKDVYEAVGLAGQTSATPIVYWPFRAQYTAGWVGANSSTDLTSAVVWAFPALGTTSYATFDAKRAYAPANFIYATADASRTQELPGGMQAYVHAATQLSPQPLVSNEQFGIGGVDTVRGYLESEALGDYGVLGQAELRSPSLARYLGPKVSSVRLHIFTDVGAADIRQPLPGQTASNTFVSVGFGARMRMLNHLSGSLEDAFPLTDGPTTHAGSQRVLFRLTGDF